MFWRLYSKQDFDPSSHLSKAFDHPLINKATKRTIVLASQHFTRSELIFLTNQYFLFGRNNNGTLPKAIYKLHLMLMLHLLQKPMKKSILKVNSSKKLNQLIFEMFLISSNKLKKIWKPHKKSENYPVNKCEISAFEFLNKVSRISRPIFLLRKSSIESENIASLQHPSSELQFGAKILKRVVTIIFISILNHWKFFVMIISYMSNINCLLSFISFTSLKHLLFTLKNSFGNSWSFSFLIVYDRKYWGLPNFLCFTKN